MTRESRPAALLLLRAYLAEQGRAVESDAGSDEALERALDLLLGWPELGFVWLAYEGEEAIAACVVCFLISTSAGGLVAKMDDFYVPETRRGQGIGSAHLGSLQEELRRMRVRRVDANVRLRNEGARRFYERHAFRTMDEERFACTL